MLDHLGEETVYVNSGEKALSGENKTKDLQGTSNQKCAKTILNI